MAWSVLQSASASADGTTVSATFTTANVQSGNKIIACVSGSGGTGTISSVKDGAGNTWTQIAASQTGTNPRAAIYALDVPAGDVGTKPTLTVTWSAAIGTSILIQEVSGLLSGNTSAMADGTAGTKVGSTSSTGSPTYSSTASNEYLIACYGDIGNGVTVSTAAGWTADAHNVNADTSSNCMVQYKNSTNGSETNGYTGADGGGWAIVEIAFKLPGGGATSGPPVSLVAVNRPALIVSNAGWRGAGHSR